MRLNGDQNWLPFGTLGRPHGVRGELSLLAFNKDTRVPSFLPVPFAVRAIFGNDVRTLTVSHWRGDRGRFLIRFEEINTRDQASTLVNFELHLPLSLFPSPAPGEIFVKDILGCQVLSVNGDPLGKVASTYWNGAQEVMQVVRENSEDRYFPIVPDFIIRCDLSAQVVVVDLHE
jgi:16S rRNA processing protein RimM